MPFRKIARIAGGVAQKARSVAARIKSARAEPDVEWDVRSDLDELRNTSRLSGVERRAATDLSARELKELDLLETQLRQTHYKKFEAIVEQTNRVGTTHASGSGRELQAVLHNFFLLGRYRRFKAKQGGPIERRISSVPVDAERRQKSDKREHISGGYVLAFYALKRIVAESIAQAKDDGMAHEKIVDKHVLPAVKYAYLIGKYSLRKEPVDPPSKVKRFLSALVGGSGNH